MYTSFFSVSVQVAWGLALLCLVYSGSVVIYNILFHPLSKFPGPLSRAGVWFIDQWHEVKGSTFREVRALHEKYGDVVRIAPDKLSFNTSQGWKDIYGTRPGKGQLPKDRSFYFFSANNTPDILNSNDSDHSRMRKLLAHAFSDAALSQQEELITPYFDLLISRLQELITESPHSEVDMVKWYNFTTFDMIGDLSFGEPFHSLENGEYHSWIVNIFKAIKFARFLRLARAYPPLEYVLRTLMGRISSIGKSRKKNIAYSHTKASNRLDTKTDRKDLISYILRHNDERGMSRAEILNTATILIAAGSETTATLLSGCTYHLLKNPHALAKVKAEIRTTFKSKSDITFKSTGQLPYLHAVLEESLRLYPPFPGQLVRRTRPEGDVIAGHFVPGNTIVGVHQWATYQDKKNFHNPQNFVPERWLEQPPKEYENDDKAALQAFSYGPRNCIGKNLAYVEMRCILAHVLWHFEMELCPESENWADQKVFAFWEKRPLKVRLTQRK